MLVAFIPPKGKFSDSLELMSKITDSLATTPLSRTNQEPTYGKCVMSNNYQPVSITPDLAQKLITDQFPEYAHLPITPVDKQGHDNRTYRLGNKMLIRMPTSPEYALKVGIEHTFLPLLASHLSVQIPRPIKMGTPSQDYPYPFSIYEWLEGTSLNLLPLDTKAMEVLAFDLARFLKELHSISDIDGPMPGQHNWWRGDHISVYNKGARNQIALLEGIIDCKKALDLWEKACSTKWTQPAVWIHGDFAIGNILLLNDKLTAIIDFGGNALGDPACDLVIAWTYLSGNARKIFVQQLGLDENTWLRARAWALWKATFELCQLQDKNSLEAIKQINIIETILREPYDKASSFIGFEVHSYT